MRILNFNEMNNVSGGIAVVVTQRISTDGISSQCAQALPELIDAMQLMDSEEEFIIKTFAFCKMSEMDLIGDRLDVASPFSVELI